MELQDLRGPNGEPTLTVCQVDPFSPSSYCYRCRYLLKPGEEIYLARRPIPVRWGKQRKKLKGNTDVTFKQHVTCPEDPSDAVMRQLRKSNL